MIELRTLGSLDLRAPDGREVRSVLAQPKRLALLVYLAIEAPGGFVRRDTLLGTFWPDSDDERARGSLRQSVRYLRRSLGAGALVNRAEDEVGIAPGTLRCDAVDFREAIERGDAEVALDLYRGEFLEGFSVSGTPEFERWLEGERKSLRSQASKVAWSLAASRMDPEPARESGHAADNPLSPAGPAADTDLEMARKWARRAVELAPYDEAGVRRLIALLDSTGNRAGAVRAFEAFATRLAADLDLEPSPETRQLIEEIRGRDEAARTEDHGRATGDPTSGPVGERTGSPSRDSTRRPAGGAIEDRRELTGGRGTDLVSDASTRLTGDRSGGLTGDRASESTRQGTGTPRRDDAAPPGPARLGFAQRIAVWGLLATPALILVGGLALWWWYPSPDLPLDPRRVVVAPFENRTGDLSLDPISSMTADWIVQGLAGRGALEVVPVTAVLASARATQPAPTVGSDASDASDAVGGSSGSSGGSAVGGTDPGPLARETGAGTVVWGSFYRQGDSIHFQASVVDAMAGRLIAALDPVATHVESPLDGIDRLRERVLLALAPLTDDRDTHVRLARIPPSYEAYRSYVTGFESFVNWDVPAALRRFERAYLADSTFHMPAIAASIMHMNLGDHAAADSLAHRVDLHRDDLGPLERATLDMVLGWLDGDEHRAWEASVRQARIAPGSIGEYQVAEQARRLNRPSETIEVLTRMGPERGELRGWFPYWRELAAANHMLGRHDEELRVARRARELYPTARGALLLEVNAFAALGQIENVHARIAERLASSSRESPAPGALMTAGARELRAHGHPEAGEALFERSIEWYRSGDTAGGSAEDVRERLAVVLYEAGRRDEAREIFLELAAENPDSPTPLGYLGVIAARNGDRAEAERIDARLRDLDQRYSWGTITLRRARISAVLGDHDRAVDLLRAAFGEGLLHGPAHHLDPDLEELRDHAGFVELMRPKE